MPELHRLTPALGVLQGRGHRVALVTDGRMSGASGKVPAAIHCTPEAADGGPLARIQDGDLIRIDTRAGTFDVLGVDLDEREVAPVPHTGDIGTGRELFRLFRNAVSSADTGATIFAALDADVDDSGCRGARPRVTQFRAMSLSFEASARRHQGGARDHDQGRRDGRAAG